MNGRTKKQHFVPRLYLANFADDGGQLWTHDSLSGTMRQAKPENTAYETNIYSPEDDTGTRLDEIEQMLARIEGRASEILPDLIACRKLDPVQKTDFSYFLATMFARSPAQLRQFAALHGAIANWAGIHGLRYENRRKESEGSISEVDTKLFDFLANTDNYEMKVDRRVGLMAFQQCDPLAQLMARMTWTYEISDDQELVTSDNCVFWVSSGPVNLGPYGFGLGHRLAVIPFPINSRLILRLDWLSGADWTKHLLDKKRARLANQYQAKHKNRFLYFRTRDDGFRKLGQKYAEPVTQLSAGVSAPKISVVRKLSQ